MPKTREPQRRLPHESSALFRAIDRTLAVEERSHRALALRAELKNLVGVYGRKPGLWAIEKMEHHVQEHGTSSFTAEGFAKTRQAIVKKTKTNFIMNFGQEHKGNPEKRMELLRKLKRGLRMELKELLNPVESRDELARRIISDLEERKTIIDSCDQKRFADEAIQALRETRKESLTVLMKYVDLEIGKIVREMGKEKSEA